MEVFSCVSCDISRLVHWNFFKIPQIHCCIALKLLAKFEDNLTSRSWEIWLSMNSVPFMEIYSCVSCDISRLVHWNFLKITQIHGCLALKLLAKFEVNLTSRSWEIWLSMNYVPFAEIFSCVSCNISKSANEQFIKNSVLNHYMLLWLYAKFEEYLIHRFWENRLFVNSEMVRCPTSHFFEICISTLYTICANFYIARRNAYSKFYHISLKIYLILIFFHEIFRNVVTKCK